ncbi:MAG: DUF1653 domain-containing protein [Anaerocolumna sp.]
MEQERTPIPGQIYKHFKNKLYQINTVAIHSETGEKMVVYQALYGSYKTYVRPLDMFVSEVDSDKYPNAQQKYRFEQVIITEEDENTNNSIPEKQINRDVNTAYDGSNGQITMEPERKISVLGSVPVTQEISENEEGSINPILLDFLEADTYEEKLAILLNKKKHINDKILNDMAVSIDCALDDGDIEGRISEFAYCLKTHARFENNRLR